MSKSYAAKDAARKRRGTRRKANKVMAERNSLPTIAVWELGDAHRGIAAQFEKFGETQVPDGMRELAERRREAKNLADVMELQTAYWQKQFGELKTLTDEVRRRSAKTRAGAGVPRRT